MNCLKVVFLLLISGCLYGQETTSHGEDNKYELISLDVFPCFPGGATARAEFIKDNLKIPYDKESCRRKKIKGKTMKVYVAFDLKSSGEIVNAKIIKGCQFECVNQAVLNVVNRMPNFQPGMKDGKAVSTKRVILPVVLQW